MKFKNIFAWLFIFIVGSLIVSFLISPNSFQQFKSNVGSVALQGEAIKNLETNRPVIEDPLLEKCKLNYLSCEEIFEEKFGLSATLIKYQKFENLQKANEFYSTWKAPLQISIESEIQIFNEGSIDKLFPLTLFAIKTTDGHATAPAVIICDKNGELIKFSKSILMCG